MTFTLTPLGADIDARTLRNHTDYLPTRGMLQQEKYPSQRTHFNIANPAEIFDQQFLVNELIVFDLDSINIGGLQRTYNEAAPPGPSAHRETRFAFKPFACLFGHTPGSAGLPNAIFNPVGKVALRLVEVVFRKRLASWTPWCNIRLLR